MQLDLPDTVSTVSVFAFCEAQGLEVKPDLLSHPVVLRASEKAQGEAANETDPAMTSLTREQQLAAMAQEILAYQSRVNGDAIVFADNGTPCSAIPIGMLMQLESALEGTLEVASNG